MFSLRSSLRPGYRKHFYQLKRWSSTIAQQSNHVKVVEVGPRDGLQNEKNIVRLNTKIGLIERLANAGLKHIEAGAFVSPNWVPQMADSSKVLEYLTKQGQKSPHQASYAWLVPNLKGLESGLSTIDNLVETVSAKNSKNDSMSPMNSPLDEISVFTAATETFSRKNTNCTIKESLDRFKPVFDLAKARNIRVRAYISVVLGCPYEGPDVSPSKVADLANVLLDMGANEISLGDTTGMGTAPRTRQLLHVLEKAGISSTKLAVHFHDTFGQALINASVALEEGIQIFDSSVAGLGGCPYAKGATGNLATEDLVYFLHAMGLGTGVDLERLAEVGDWISTQLGRQNGSRVGRAIMSRRREKI
ncbi:MAG: Iron-sulfur clusters transporter atm1, mitochondrial [Watsoniomyces obsoletus]|nr:MAG: Iron-sulfur clusters transporter atm1, mitochondrial [Watsoniomyces obsoletus]